MTDDRGRTVRCLRLRRSQATTNQFCFSPTTDVRRQTTGGPHGFPSSGVCPPSSDTRPLPAWWLLQGDQTRSHPELGRQTPSRQWYSVSRHGRVGRRQACKGRKASSSNDFFRRPPNRRPTNRGPSPSRSATSLVPRTRRPAKSPNLRQAAKRHPDAGWSSPVARQAHNLKAAGSNPAPATSLTC